eukprot:scaffold3070_cov128-Cylindrotheca_fusiformis.AAC.1
MDFLRNLQTVAEKEKEKQKLESEERKSQSNMKTCEKAMPINEQKESNLDLPIGDDDGSRNDTEESEDSEQKCAICWEVFAENEKMCWSRNPECSHAFHLDCIESWLLMHDRCPICRNRYLVSRAATPANAEGAPPSESSTPSRSIINPRTESANGDTIVNRLLETFRIKRSTRSERDDCLSSSRAGRSIVLSEGVVDESVVEEPEVISLPSLQPSVPIDIEKGSEQNIST